MEDSKEIKDHIVDYLMQGGEADVADPVLIEWLDESESNRKLFYQFKKIWIESVNYMEREKFNPNTAWNNIDRIHKRKEKSRKRLHNFYYSLSGAAAILLIVIALSVTGWFGQAPEIEVGMTVNRGSRSNIILPDGSMVKLNADSEITYSYNPKKKIREVSFQGEGFFDIVKSNEPFVVKLTNDLRVEVLGTIFNLRAYADEKIMETSLIEGVIQMNYHDENLLMKAGEMVVFDTQTNEMRPISGEPLHTCGWLENKLYMENMSLSDICKPLERWYDVDIIMDEKLGDSIFYTGVLQEETILDVMDALSTISKIKYHVKGKHIFITSK